MKKLICRVCKKKGELVIDLNLQPLANAILNKKKREKHYPLKIFRCKNCKTLQLVDNVNPNILFKNYVWVTGTSISTVNYLKKFSNYIFKKFNNNFNLKILEVASNDGTFIEILKKKFEYVKGVEPASNLARLANSKGNKTFNLFFNYISAKKIIKKLNSKVDLIICRNVIPHINNLHTVFKGVNLLLNENGKLIIEFHYAKEIIQNMQFDYIYHEHTYYFTIQTLSYFAKLYDLYPNDVKESKISGGSLILTFSKNKKQSIKLKNMIKNEQKLKINSLNKIKKFNNKLIKYRSKIKKIIENKNYLPIAGYGSSARSNTLLNFVKLKNNCIEYIFDNNSLKHNKYTPGTQIKIIKPKKKNKKKFKTIIVFAWNFYDEIKKDLIKLGYKGRIIKTLPKIRIEKI